MSEDFFSSTSFKNKLKREYEEIKGLYERLVDEVLYMLRESIEKNKIKIHTLTARETKVKTFESFYGKVIRKQLRNNQFEAIEDIAGVRVICLYRSDLERVGSVISENFDVIRADTTTTRSETPFGYASDQYVVKLPKECKGPRYDHIKNLKCEIQVRTILMDAWASVSHHLDYKKQVDIPRELRTDFNALAGLFYVADTHFELFKEGIEESRASLMKTVEQGMFDLDQEINLDSLTAYLQWKFPERKIESVMSDIVSELREHGYQNIRQLDDKINIASPVLKQLENEIFNQKKWKPRWAPGGLIRASLDLTDDKYFFKRRMPSYARKRKEKYRAKLKKKIRMRAHKNRDLQEDISGAYGKNVS